MELINNTTRLLRDDLASVIKKGSKVSIVASCFSIYAYEALKNELEQIDELRFIFDSPTFTTEKYSKEKREFFIPKTARERSICGTEFEIKLRNELQQKAVARECAEWVRRKVKFRSNINTSSVNRFVMVDDYTYQPVNEFTTVGLGVERGNVVSNIMVKLEGQETREYVRLFEALWNDQETYEDVTQQVLDNITVAYNENSPEFIYFVALYNIFSEFLEDVSEDVLPNESTGYRKSAIWNMLFDFQRDAALAIINKLEKYNGCILADSVGLGKTFTALSVIKYYENRNKNVLVLCPKKLYNNWSTYKGNYKNNPIASDRLRYDILFHTDMNRKSGISNGIDLALLNWGNYDLVVIDESHNFRNGGKLVDDPEHKDNRYETLMKNVIRAGVKTKVLMLSATPVNTKFTDLRNQLQLAYEGDSQIIDEKLNTKSSINDIFKNAQKAFNEWSKYPVLERTTEKLLSMLDFDFFEVLDSVTIARSRKHIEKYYNIEDVGRFPERLRPISLRPGLVSDNRVDITYDRIFQALCELTLSVYVPSKFIHPSKLSKYEDIYARGGKGSLSQTGRELGIRRLMAINLMKRMESSVYSFRLTLEKIIDLIEKTIDRIGEFERHGAGTVVDDYSDSFDESDDEMEGSEELFTIGNTVKIDLADMDYASWRMEMELDLSKLQDLEVSISSITPERDEKLQTLVSQVKSKVLSPINEGNKKIIIFTAFADTADYLYENLKSVVNDIGLEMGMVTGGVEKTTLGRGLNDMNTILTLFSPISKDKDKLFPNDNRSLDVLIATDCISEGQNLQDCDYLINFDIHWNPVRIIQRFGRIDRIGSKNNVIQLVNFWPDVTLDEYINLKSRVESRMKIVNLTATADDNLLSPEEKTDLEYRKEQLQRLQKEVVDLEEMNTGISIVDLGLNEFRLDLLEYSRNHPELPDVPHGLNAVTLSAGTDTPPGVIYILKNRTNGVNIDNLNRLHPFYLVYIKDSGDISVNHLQPKALLDKMRLLCKGNAEPIEDAYAPFNKETRSGKNMYKYSDLLTKAISSIINVKEESDLDQFLSGVDVSFGAPISGLDDFELICFLVVR